MKTMKLAAVALVLPGAAAAQLDLPADVMDGASITVEEVRANSALLFDRFAGPGGGPIPRARFVNVELPAELVPGRPDRQVLEGLFELLDISGDGELTRDEWTRRIEQELGFADANGDGRITLEELSKARENLSLGDALGLVF